MLTPLRDAQFLVNKRQVLRLENSRILFTRGPIQSHDLIDGFVGVLVPSCLNHAWQGSRIKGGVRYTQDQGAARKTRK